MLYLELIELIIILSLFSFEMAIALYQYKIEKYKAIMIMVYFVLGIIVSVFVSNIYSSFIIGFVNDYLTMMMILLAILVVYTGFKLIQEFKNINSYQDNLIKSLKTQKKEIHNLNEFKVKYFKFNKKIQFYGPLLLLIICSYFGIFLNIIYVSPIIWINILELGLISSIISFILILVLYLFLSYFLKKLKSYGFIGNIVMLSGMYLLIVYAFVPNFQYALSNEMSSLIFPSFNTILCLFIIGIIAFLFGFVLKKSKKFKNFI